MSESVLQDDRTAYLAQGLEAELFRQFPDSKDLMVFLLYWIPGIVSHCAAPGKNANLYKSFVAELDEAFKARLAFDKLPADQRFGK